MNLPQSCPETDLLQAMLRGTVSEADEYRIAEHLESCAACRSAVDRIAGVDGELSTLIEMKFYRNRLTSPLQAGTERPSAARLCDVMERLKEGRSPKNDSSGPETHYIPSEMDVFIQQLMSESESGAIARIGHYELGERVGRGGMGTVYKAMDRKLNRQVAIKFLKPELMRDPVFIERFEREAQAAAGIVHRNVVTVHGIEETNGVPWIVMEYIEGESLRNRIRRQGPLTLTSVARIGVQIAAGLQAAHAARLIHRDIKPSNIVLLGRTDEVRITDFGLAHLEGTQRLTKSGLLMGTPEYMAPEQARGEAIDYRTDLFSLGSVLYAMCVGQAPFRGDNPAEIASNVAMCRMIPLTDVDPTLPHWLIRLISRLLEKKPEDRFQSAGKVVSLLQKKLGSSDLSALSTETDWNHANAEVTSREFYREAAETLVEAKPFGANSVVDVTQRSFTATAKTRSQSQTTPLRWSGSAWKWMLGTATGLSVLWFLMFFLADWRNEEEQTVSQNNPPPEVDQLPPNQTAQLTTPDLTTPDQTHELDQGLGPFVVKIGQRRQRFERLMDALDAVPNRDSVLIETDGDVFVPQVTIGRPVTIRAGWNQSLNRPFEPVLRRTVESIVSDRRWMLAVQSDVRLEGLEILYESEFGETPGDRFSQAPIDEWAIACHANSHLVLVNCRIRMRPGTAGQIGIKADAGPATVHVKNSEFFGGAAAVLTTAESLTIENSLFIGPYAIILTPQSNGAGRLEIKQSTFICESLLAVCISRGWRMMPVSRKRFSVEARNSIFDASKSLVLVKQLPDFQNAGGMPDVFLQPDAIRRLPVSTLVWSGEFNVYDVPDKYIAMQRNSGEQLKGDAYSMRTLKAWSDLWRGNARLPHAGVYYPARGFEGFDEKLIDIETADDLQPQIDGHRPSSGTGAVATGPGEGYRLYCTDLLSNQNRPVE